MGKSGKDVPPPPADCTAVVESPARKKAGGFAFGAANAEDVKVAIVARSGRVEKCILAILFKSNAQEMVMKIPSYSKT
jgi:hypothetical protein